MTRPGRSSADSASPARWRQPERQSKASHRHRPEPCRPSESPRPEVLPAAHPLAARTLFRSPTKEGKRLRTTEENLAKQLPACREIRLTEAAGKILPSRPSHQRVL